MIDVSLIDLIIVFCYPLFALLLGIWAARTVKSVNDYQVGGRQYNSWTIFATLFASFIGGGFTLGLAEKTFLHGFFYIVAICGFSLKKILVAIFIAPRIKSFNNALTVGDVMEKSFGQQTKIITGIASVIICIGIMVAQICACSNVLNVLLDLPNFIITILIFSIIVIYASYGGMKSVVVVGTLHCITLCVMLPLVLIYSLINIDIIKTTFLINPIKLINATSIGTIDFITLFVSFFLGETLIPPYFQRLLIGKTVKDTVRGTLWSGILSIPFFFIVGCIGLIALNLEPNIPATIALPHVINTVMPIGLKGAAIAAMLAIIMSSADSLLNSAATAMTNDILLPLGFGWQQSTHKLIFSKVITLLIGIMVIILALGTTSSLDILIYSYQFWTPFILTPLIAAIFGVVSTDKVFLIAAAVGISSVMIWNLSYSGSLIEGALDGVICGVILNSITFFICHKLCTHSAFSQKLALLK